MLCWGETIGLNTKSRINLIQKLKLIDIDFNFVFKPINLSCPIRTILTYEFLTIHLFILNITQSFMGTNIRRIHHLREPPSIRSCNFGLNPSTWSTSKPKITCAIRPLRPLHQLHSSLGWPRLLTDDNLAQSESSDTSCWGETSCPPGSMMSLNTKSRTNLTKKLKLMLEISNLYLNP